MDQQESHGNSDKVIQRWPKRAIKNKQCLITGERLAMLANGRHADIDDAGLGRVAMLLGNMMQLRS
jgi:hypothetical protein